MNLDIFSKNLSLFKEISENYDRLMKEEKELGKEIEELKDRYEKNLVKKSAFAVPNRKLEEVKAQLTRIRMRVSTLIKEMREVIEEEAKNV